MNSDEFFRAESKIYTKKSIGLATFFGGPIVTGYMVSENFKSFGEQEKARAAMINGLFGTAVFFSALLAIPEKYMELIPTSLSNSLFPALYTMIGVWWMEKVQGNNIKQHIEQGGGTYSRWKASGIGLIGMVITLVFIFAQSFAVGMLTPELEGKKIEISENSNRVYYENIDSAAVAAVLDTLRKDKFFDINYDFFFKIEGREDGFRLLFPAIKQYWDSPEIVGHYAAYLSFLTRSFPEKNVEVALFQEGFSGREFREITFEDSISIAWMMPPVEEETDYQVAERVMHYLDFWESFFSYGIQSEAESMAWQAIPNVLNFASNGMALVQPDMVTQEWQATFGNQRSATKAYRILADSFTGVSWPANAMIFKSYVTVLNEMKGNVQHTMKEIQKAEEAASKS